MQGGRNGAPSRRATPRLKVFQPAHMVLGGISVRIHLLDISIGGALVHVADPPEQGAGVALDCAGIVRSATVRWVVGSRFGIAFDEPLSDAELEAVIATQSSGPLRPRGEVAAR
ncbi:PilZ domain-containing protein [Sphingomonas colocasiae]|uniref:PilZ domain-containing protein n=1 Tax=Sphingomonas colocasiae TaxID=1848973 RepID=A0ABS7PY33_9SPHN|nr:PilZ domain-containing protein [Sphingomonas colocasiae]